MSTEARRMSVIVDSRGINAVAADLNKLDQVGNRVSSGLGKITNKLKDFGSWIMRHKLMITAAAAVISAAIIIPYSKLETALVRTRIALDGTAEDMQLLEDLAIHLGQNTVYSATEAAEGMLQLAKAGYAVNEIVAATPGVLNAAIVEELDLATASEIVVSALAMFKLGADQATRAADVLAKGANIALTDMPGLAEGLKMVGYTASEMGYSLEEAVALMSMLSQFKIEGSMAGTALRSGAAAFSEFGLGQYTAVQKTILKTLGIGTDVLTKKIASGELDLVRFLARLSEAGAEIGHMNILFGQRAGQTMLAIAQGAATVFDEYVESLENAVGFTERAGGLLEDTVSGSMKRIKNSVLTMTNALMRTVAPDFVRFLDTELKPFIDRVTDEWERGGATWSEKMTSVFKNVLAPAMEKGLEMLGQMIHDWTPELVRIFSEVVDAAVPAVVSGLARGLWTITKTAAEGWLFGLPKVLARGADQLIGPYMRLFPHGYDIPDGEGYDTGRTFRDQPIRTNWRAEELANRINMGAPSPYLPGLPETLPVGPLRLPEEPVATVAEEPKLTFWGRLGALWTQGVDYIRRLLGVSEKTEENTSDLAGSDAAAEDPLTSFLSQGLGALESTLLSAVTEPITSELEEWLEPVSSRLGSLTSNVLHKFDYLLISVTSILDWLVDRTGGKDYMESRTSAQGQFAFAPAGAGGGTSYSGGGVQIQNLNIQGYRDGEAAGKAAAAEIAKSEEISTRAMARGLRAGMTSREAQEY